MLHRKGSGLRGCDCRAGLYGYRRADAQWFAVG